MVLHKTGRLQKSVTDEINNLNANYQNTTEQLKAKVDALNSVSKTLSNENKFNSVFTFIDFPMLQLFK